MATERERILAQAGDPLSLNEVRGEQAEQTTQTLKYSPEVFLEFGKQIMNLLSQSRQLGTALFVEEELSARERMAEEVLKPAEAGMPPTLQQKIRSAEVSSLEPLLTGARERRQTFAEQLRGFGTALEQARVLGTTLASLEQRVLENQLTAKQEARKTIESMYKLGGKQAFSHLDDKEKRKWEALAGLPKGFIDALPEVETEEWTEPYTLSTGEVVQKNKLTGEIKVISKPSAKAGQPEFSQLYSTEMATRTISKVDDLLRRVSRSTVGGLALILSKVPETSAYNFKADLESLKSNIAFNELTAMRQASKTGGALGQVSDREGRLLESALASLDIGQSPEHFEENLRKIKESIQRWQNVLKQYQSGNLSTTPSQTKIEDPLGLFK
ncbi:hypothetical protein DRJ17_05535 [Candidatus Woesearchaeota archaeon]|nr:MAG: hypothetical protein DRJ17_05535 [Candidatus Woesearchaeota archaeon]